jgi:hypothetical protein
MPVGATGRIETALLAERSRSSVLETLLGRSRDVMAYGIARTSPRVPRWSVGRWGPWRGGDPACHRATAGFELFAVLARQIDPQPLPAGEAGRSEVDPDERADRRGVTNVGRSHSRQFDAVAQAGTDPKCSRLGANRDRGRHARFPKREMPAFWEVPGSEVAGVAYALLLDRRRRLPHRLSQPCRPGGYRCQRGLVRPPIS